MVREAMTFQELSLRVLDAVQGSIPAVMIVLALSLLAILAAVVQIHGMWVNQKRFNWLGILFGLSGGDCLRLSGSWIKFLLVLAYLALFRSMTAADYLLLIVPGLIYAISFKSPGRIPGRLVWLFFELLGLLSANMVCGFYKDMDAGIVFVIIYVVMAILVSLFAWYLFLTELQEISQSRKGELSHG